MEHSNRVAVVAVVVVEFVVVVVAVVLVPEMVVDMNYNYPLMLNSNPVAIEFELVEMNLGNSMILYGSHLNNKKTIND